MKKRSKRFPDALKATRHLTRVDALLGDLIKEVGGIKIELDPTETVYESLASSIIYQQLHGKAAAAILARFKTLCGKGGRFPHPKAVITARVPALRKTGLSGSKIQALKDLSEKVLSKSVPDRKLAHKMTDQELIEAFSSVRGVGPWTAQMLLIFTLGRTDVLPIGDYGVRRGYAAVYGKKQMPKPKELEALGTKWSPYRTAASWYFWRALEIERYKKIKFED